MAFRVPNPILTHPPPIREAKDKCSGQGSVQPAICAYLRNLRETKPRNLRDTETDANPCIPYAKLSSVPKSLKIIAYFCKNKK